MHSTVVGARPQFVKAAIPSEALRWTQQIENVLVTKTSGDGDGNR